MQQRLVLRYSMSFKRQVVSELESGRFDSIGQASEHYGIAGSETVRKWLGGRLILLLFLWRIIPCQKVSCIYRYGQNGQFE